MLSHSRQRQLLMGALGFHEGAVAPRLLGAVEGAVGLAQEQVEIATARIGDGEPNAYGAPKEIAADPVRGLGEDHA